MSSILVTGGAGFIGSHLCERLISAGEEVVCVDSLNDYYSPLIKKENIKNLLDNPSFSFYPVDILDVEGLDDIVCSHDIGKIVHLAARAGVRPSIMEPALYARVNIEGTLNLLEISQKRCVEQFILASSSSVYGINSKVPYSEDDPVERPISPYAASKRACELFCFNYSHLYGIPSSCMRFFTVYGPRQRPEMAIHKFTRLIDRGETIPVYAMGESKRDYTYIDDVVSGLMAAVGKKFEFELFNLGNSNVVDLKYLISLIEENLGKTAKIKYLPDQAGDVPLTYADISKSRRLLGYDPKTPIEKGIELFVEWYKNH